MNTLNFFFIFFLCFKALCIYYVYSLAEFFPLCDIYSFSDKFQVAHYGIKLYEEWTISIQAPFSVTWKSCFSFTFPCLCLFITFHSKFLSLGICSDESCHCLIQTGNTVSGKCPIGWCSVVSECVCWYLQNLTLHRGMHCLFQWPIILLAGYGWKSVGFRRW